MPLTISIVIPVRNGGEPFRRCLSGLVEDSASAEILVVADGDTGDSVRVAEAAGVRVLQTAGPSGPACARNVGAAAARGDVLLFVDADVLAAPGTVRRVAEAFEKDPGLAALFGSYDDAPAAANFLSQYKNLLHHYTHQISSGDASTFWAGCGAIRRDAFLAVGGFDERYRYPSIEDIELGYRLKQAGYRIRLCKDIQVKHLKKWTVANLIGADLFHRALPWTALILKSRRLPNDLNLKTSSRASVALIWAIVIALIGGFRWHAVWVAAGPMALVLLFLNLPVYRFLARKRGLGFAVRSVPWHWLYFFYSGLALGLGIVRSLGHRRDMPPARPIRLQAAGVRRPPEVVR